MKEQWRHTAGTLVFCYVYICSNLLPR